MSAPGGNGRFRLVPPGGAPDQLVGPDGAPVMSEAALRAKLEAGREAWAASMAAKLFGQMMLATVMGKVRGPVNYQVSGHGLGDGSNAEGLLALALVRNHLVSLHAALVPGEVVEMLVPPETPLEVLAQLPPEPRLLLQWTPVVGQDGNVQLNQPTTLG